MHQHLCSHDCICKASCMDDLEPTKVRKDNIQISIIREILREYNVRMRRSNTSVVNTGKRNRMNQLRCPVNSLNCENRRSTR